VTGPRYPDLTGSEPCISTDPDAFHPEIGSNATNWSTLRRICSGCPTLDPCRDWAIAFEDYGFWGGMTPDERRAARRLRGMTIRPSRPRAV
jgi:WhiB family redox-sensing transcriptional regulator